EDQRSRLGEDEEVEPLDHRADCGCEQSPPTHALLVTRSKGHAPLPLFRCVAYKKGEGGRATRPVRLSATPLDVTRPREVTDQATVFALTSEKNHTPLGHSL